MDTLAWRCAAIIGWVVALTEIDRYSEFFDLGVPAYALAGASVLLLVVPALRRTNILLALAVAFPFFFALEVASGPVDLRRAGSALIEFGGVGIAIVLAARLAQRLALAEEVLREFAIGPAPDAVEPFSRTQGEMFREVRRARRHERPLSLLALSASGAQPPAALAQLLEQARRESAERYLAGKVAALLEDQTAGSSVIADRGDHFLLLLPEATRQEAEHVAKRLERTASERHGIALCFGIASFPHQEITFDKLLETAEAELRDVERTARSEPEQVPNAALAAPSAPAGS